MMRNAILAALVWFCVWRSNAAFDRGDRWRARAHQFEKRRWPR